MNDERENRENKERGVASGGNYVNRGWGGESYGHGETGVKINVWRDGVGGIGWRDGGEE